MKRNVLFATLLFTTGSLLAADATPQDDVKAAAQKLAARDNYSWKSTPETPATAGGGGGGGGRLRPGPIEGKTEKAGYTFLSMKRGDNTVEVVLKGDKGAFKTPDGDWTSVADAAKD